MSLSTRDIRFLSLSLVLGGLTLVVFRIAVDFQTVVPFFEKCWMGKDNGIELHPYLQIGVLDSLHCSMTQIFHETARNTPGGPLAGMTAFVAFMPWLVLIALEAGRSGAKGLIRYPMIVALILQMGAGLFLLTVYIPCFIFGRCKEQNPLPKGYILAAIFPPLAYIIFASLTFFAATDTTLWKVSAGILSGWLIIYSFVPVWLASGGQPLEREASRRLSTVPYIVTGTIAFIGWLGILVIVTFQMGADLGIMFNLLWKDATPMVRFFFIDATSISMASILLVAYLRESVLKECLALSALFGPGSGIAMTLAGLEVEDVAPEGDPVEASAETKKND